MKLPIYQIDAFTGKVFAGNPAAVCPLESWLDDKTLQSIAAENNLSETAFFVPKGDAYEIRWFTPGIEVELCGHATLASAHVIFNYLGYKNDVIRFETRKSGELTVRKEGDLLSMNFPSSKPTPVPCPGDLTRALRIEPVEVLKSSAYLAIFESEDQVRSLKPDFPILNELDAYAVIVTAKGKTVDFVSRFFAYKIGIPEDPVTGSAHCTSVPYWSEKLGKTKLHALQVSERGGELFCEDLGDRVKISGRAVQYLIGQIDI
ncbi:MAG: PhzF family phenazine biosynthesis protein [candidate division Zixibacteria bacterium]|nr:PhzF family phenazine biosynthesis protein [candidate division Zixibacteria bacterium]MBU1471139.1 PhzF family phenazine biosynthesis protein [candidate division Zixibacteria bacterium]MBU2626655.1 PhzF family phenazine biosynthesis protein [candidate division Zixibacteria bacterium]